MTSDRTFAASVCCAVSGRGAAAALSGPDAGQSFALTLAMPIDVLLLLRDRETVGRRS
jgi:hypothetical protein